MNRTGEIVYYLVYPDSCTDVVSSDMTVERCKIQLFV